MLYAPKMPQSFCPSGREGTCRKQFNHSKAGVCNADFKIVQRVVLTNGTSGWVESLYVHTHLQAVNTSVHARAVVYADSVSSNVSQFCAPRTAAPDALIAVGP